ncbi:hypothetical protein [Frigoriglobus tundricola]|uniref:hypothetical protein n=1 Tax=Frigoriglobus tundricola TaxID=2774151 RepID=UPI00148ED7DB|nr:hypothetical protein [Frigoriglobus tundricola]
MYLADLWRAHLVLSGAPERFDRVRVIGRHRKSMGWINSFVRADFVVNWRAELVYHPGALALLKRDNWAGFRLERGAFTCPADKASGDTIRALFAALGAPVV